MLKNVCNKFKILCVIVSQSLIMLCFNYPCVFVTPIVKMFLFIVVKIILLILDDPRSYSLHVKFFNDNGRRNWIYNTKLNIQKYFGKDEMLEQNPKLIVS